MTIVWIVSHIGVESNENAGSLASSDFELPKTDVFRNSLTTAENIGKYREVLKRKWLYRLKHQS